MNDKKTKKGLDWVPIKIIENGNLPPSHEPPIVGIVSNTGSRFLTWTLGILAVAGAITLYYRTTCPVVYYGDAGELTVAAWRWGIAHPPGYPSYIILLGIFLRLPLSWLAPDAEFLQTIAWQANFFSAVIGSLTVGVIYLILLRLTQFSVLSFAGAVLVATGQTFWSQTGIAEVYTLNAFFAALMVLFAILQVDSDPGSRGRIKYLRWGSVIWGLSLANHHEMVFFFPLWIVMLALAIQKNHGNSRAYKPPVSAILNGVGFLALGLIPYLYLPIAASFDPPLNWGDPSSWNNFWAVFTREVYRNIKSNITEDLVTSLDILWKFLFWSYVQYFSIYLLLAIPGLIWIFRPSRYRPVMIGTAISLFFMSLVFIIYFAGIDRPSLFFLEVYFIPWYIALGCLITLGAAFVVNILVTRTKIKISNFVGIATLLILLGTYFSYTSNYRKCDMSDNIAGYVYSHDILAVLPDSPQKSILISTGDEIFLFWYWKWVEGIDKEVACVGQDALGSCENWFWDDLKRDQPDVILPCEDGDQLDRIYAGQDLSTRMLERLIRSNRGGYRIWTTSWDSLVEAIIREGPWHMVQDGPAIELEWDSEGKMSDYTRSSRLEDDYIFLELLNVDRVGLAPFEQQVYNHYAVACYNLAVFLTENGEYDRAIDFAGLCLEFYPGFYLGERLHTPYELMAFNLYNAGYYASAREFFKNLAGQNPNNSIYHVYLAEISQAEGDIDSAIEELGAAIELEPDNEYYHERYRDLTETRDNQETLESDL